MSHTRALVVSGGVVLCFGLLCVGWVLSSPWKVEDISLRGAPRPELAKRNPELDKPREFALQPASVTPFPDQKLERVKRQPALVNDAVAAPAKRALPAPADLPQPAAADPFPDQQPAKFKGEPGPRVTKLQLVEPRVALQGTPAERLEQLLEQPVTLEVTNATVDDIVAMLRAALPANVLIDAKALDELAYDRTDFLKASSAAPLKLQQALDLLLSDAQLDFILENDSLLITARIKADNHPVTKIYDVSELIRPAGVEHEHEVVDFDSLINQISTHVLPPSFENNNGQPKIFPIENGDLLVIPHSRRGHEQIAKLLNELRRGRGLKIPETLKLAGLPHLAQQQEPVKKTAVEAAPLPDMGPYCRLELADDGLSPDLLKKMKPAERLGYQLRRRALLRMNEAKLEDLVLELRKQLEVNVLIDKKALEEAAFDTATPLEASANAATRLSGSLRLVLRQYGLSYVVDQDSLLITTRTAEENTQILRYYVVGEFIRPLGSSPNTVGADFDSLIQLIQSTIQPTTWKANGGQGDVAPQEILDLLIVSNTWEVHELLEEFLGQLRKVHARKAETVQANEAVLQRVVYQLVLPRQENIKETLDKNGAVTNREILSGELEYSMDDLVDMIKKTIEPASWNDDKHQINVLGESLIVTHSQATQRKLHELLHDLGITQAQHQPLQQHGYLGGGFGGGGGLGGGGGGLGGPVGRPVGPPRNNNNTPPSPGMGGINSGGIF